MFIYQTWKYIHSTNTCWAFYIHKLQLYCYAKKMIYRDTFFVSWHEIGIRDLPAMIDHVVNTTGREKLFYLGHSQGTTTFFVMAVELPEYQDKIQAMFALAPVAYCGRLPSPLFQFLAKFSGSINVCSINIYRKIVEIFKFFHIPYFINRRRCWQWWEGMNSNLVAKLWKYSKKEYVRKTLSHNPCARICSF